MGPIVNIPSGGSQSLLLGPENGELADALEQTLLGQKPLRLLIVGPPGSGKTLIVKTLSWSRRIKSQPPLLVVDDLHRLKGSKKQHCVATHLDQSDAAVLTSAVPPTQLNLVPRLADRLTELATVEIKPPAFATRVALLRHFARRHQVPLTDTLAQDLATRWSDHAGLIEKRLLNLARGLVAPHAPEHLDHVPLQAIQATTARFYQIAPSQLSGPHRHRKLVHARRMGMFLARQLSGRSLAEIGQAFGHKDHTTVLYHCRTLEKLLQRSPELRDELRRLENEVFKRHLQAPPGA